VTKVGFRIDQNNKIVGRDSTPTSVIAHAEGCLKRLGTDHIDLLLIHWPDHNTPIPDTMGALEKLKAAGKIRHYGVSNFSVQMMDTCQRHGHLAANQIGYHMFDRRMEAAVLPYCLEHKIGFMAYGTLGFGLLTGAFTPQTTFVDWDWRHGGKAFSLPLFEREDFLKELRVVDRLKALAGSYNKSVAQLAIAWVLAQPAVTVALVGMRNTRELDENVAAADWRLTDADRAEIDRIFAEESVPTYVDTQLAL
jgi:aryl-alcohol dehydrogenase-like predicted oxidoreductase